MMSRDQIRQIAENIRDCCDKSRALDCKQCKAKHRDGFMKCRDSNALMVAKAIEQLLQEVNSK